MHLDQFADIIIAGSILLAGVGWFFRLEFNNSANKEKNKILEKRIEKLEATHVQFEKEIATKLSEIEVALARIEGFLRHGSDSQKNPL